VVLSFYGFPLVPRTHLSRTILSSDKDDRDDKDDKDAASPTASCTLSCTAGDEGHRHHRDDITLPHFAGNDPAHAKIAKHTRPLLSQTPVTSLARTVRQGSVLPQLFFIPGSVLASVALPFYS
jgi:hypothetical protein